MANLYFTHSLEDNLMSSTNDDKIYLIEDNKFVSHALISALNELISAPVQNYHDPVTFLQEFSPHWRGCILTDFFMPTMNGIELIHELKQRNNALPIIVLSGHGSMEVAKQAKENGAAAFLNKPFKIEKLVAIINVCMGTHFNHF